MQRPAFLLAASALLASCQSIPDPAPPPMAGQAPYKAIGTEPFWSLAIEGGKMNFRHEGVREVTGSSYEARPSFNGWRYLSQRINADVTFAPCSDGMSDKTYKDTVTVMVDGQKYKGCGGGELPPETLENTSWRIVALDGTAVSEGIDAEVRFADGRIAGTAGCNRFSGPYSANGGALNFGAVVSTKMMCPEPQMTQERKFFALLGSGTLTKRFSASGDLVLSNEAGGSATLRRNI